MSQGLEGAQAPSAELVAAVEALLFASGAPLSVRQMGEVLEGVPEDDIVAALERIAQRCEATDRGIELTAVAGGWQLRTKERFAAMVHGLHGTRPARLSRAALEVLSVIAYRQPVTRAEIEAIRGVDCGGVLKTLLERQLVGVAGRRDEPGRPLTYQTTQVFLEVFSLPSLAALPTLREREELVRDSPPDD